jgi:hypothetical protein
VTVLTLFYMALSFRAEVNFVARSIKAEADRLGGSAAELRGTGCRLCSGERAGPFEAASRAAARWSTMSARTAGGGNPTDGPSAAQQFVRLGMI